MKRWKGRKRDDEPRIASKLVSDSKIRESWESIEFQFKSIQHALGALTIFAIRSNHGFIRSFYFCSYFFSSTLHVFSYLSIGFKHAVIMSVGVRELLILPGWGHSSILESQYYVIIPLVKQVDRRFQWVIITNSQLIESASFCYSILPSIANFVCLHICNIRRGRSTFKVQRSEPRRQSALKMVNFHFIFIDVTSRPQVHSIIFRVNIGYSGIVITSARKKRGNHGKCLKTWQTKRAM